MGKQVRLTLKVLVAASVLASCAELPVKEYNTATGLRNRIQKYTLKEYAPIETGQGDTFYEDGMKYYNRDNGKSRTSLDAAISNYQTAVDRGFPAKIGSEAIEAASNKMQALALKADRYRQKKFEDADALYHQALTEKDAGNYESALDKIESARSAFLELYRQAKAMWDSSSGLIDQVQQKLEAVDREAGAIASEKAESEKIENSLQSGTNTNL